jgi:pimeloyl-ACP methyl ester carboxylesterase
MVDKMMDIYASYYKSPKNFVRSLPGVNRITTKDITSYFHFFVQELTEQTPEALLTRSTVTSFDGTVLTTHVGGPADAPTVVLVNAYGMPIDFWMPIVKRLVRDFRVVSWDSRGVPSMADDFRVEHCSVADQARDMKSVLDAFGVRAATVLGWCTGSQVALKFAAEHPDRVLAAALLNGVYSLPSSVQSTQFKRNIHSVMPRIAASREAAAKYHEMLYGSRGDQSYRGQAATSASDEEMAVEVLEATDETLLSLTSAPYRTPESLYRYANLVMHLADEPDHAWTTDVRFPTLVVSGTKDVISHPEESREVARRIPHAELLMLDEGTHFALYNEEAVASTVVEFLRAGATTNSATPKVA